MFDLAHEAGMRGLEMDCPGWGSKFAKIAIVGEAPGLFEKRLKQPFVGGSGRHLFEVLRKDGILREECYVTNVVKRQIEEKKLYETERLQWQDVLRLELAELEHVEYLLLLGNEALLALTNRRGISGFAGTVERVDLSGGRAPLAIYNYNPAAVLRQQQLMPLFALFCRKLRRVMDGEWRPPSVLPCLNPTEDEVFAWLERFEKSDNPISLDIETPGGETGCIGLSNDGVNALCVNFRTINGHQFGEKEEIRVRKRLSQFLLNERNQFIMQNGSFDMSWLWYKDRMRVHSCSFDTLLAHHTLYPTMPHDLGTLVAQYTDHPYYKEDRTLWKEGEDIDSHWLYNTKDAALTWLVAQGLRRELEAQGLLAFFRESVMPLQKHLVRMTVSGVKCDVELKDSVRDEQMKAVNALEERFHDAVIKAVPIQGYRPNPGSPKQMQDLFFNKLKLVGRGQSTDKTNRLRLLMNAKTSEEAKVVVRAHGEWAKEQKFLSTYAEMEIDEDGRIRCDYKQYGVQNAPGRLSSSGTLWGSGQNLQNQPDRAKKVFVADEGYGFVYFDLAQAEARIVAYLADVTGLIAAFEDKNGRNVHRMNAMRIFQKPYEEIPEYDYNPDGSYTLRYLGKRCVHGLNYRMQRDRLAETCGISISLASMAYDSYHKAFPEISKWWKYTENEARTKRELFSPLGRRLKLFGFLDDGSLDSIIAFKPQSTVGDHVSQTIRRCHEDRNWPSDSLIVLNVHDALIAICPLGKMRWVAGIMKHHAEKPIRVVSMNGVPHDVVIPAEFAFSQPDEKGVHRWSTLKKVKF